MGAHPLLSEIDPLPEWMRRLTFLRIRTARDPFAKGKGNVHSALLKEPRKTKSSNSHVVHASGGCHVPRLRGHVGPLDRAVRGCTTCPRKRGDMAPERTDEPG